MTLLPVLMNFIGGTAPPTPDGAGGGPTTRRVRRLRRRRRGPLRTRTAATGRPAAARRTRFSLGDLERGEQRLPGGPATPPPSDYAAVFAATRAALRSVDPPARTVVGGLVFDAAGQSSFVSPAADDPGARRHQRQRL